jgi:hypothetical protein
MKNYSRRDFTRHLGLAALFSPFLSMIEAQPARAAAGKAKYLLVFFTNGTDVAAWSPKGSSESSISFSPMTENLAPIKGDVILVDNLNSNGTASSHGAPGGLTGFNYGGASMISVEQYAGDQLKAAGIKTQIPNLILGSVPSEQQTTFYRDSRALTPISSLSSAYQAIFGGALPPSDPSSPSMPSMDAENRLRRRKSVLDTMKAELNALSQTLGTHERQKLEVHTDSIRQLEERLAQQSGGGDTGGGGVVMPVNCSKPSAPGGAMDPLPNSAALLDMALSAFGCDITRVAAVQFGHHQNTQVNIPEVGMAGDWHNGFMHSDNPRTRLVNLEKWLCKEFVKAADKLKALPAPDGSGTLWDQTIMVWARDMGDGVQHDGSNMRFVFSGGAGGYLKKSAGGRYINGGGAFHQRALINALEAIGITNYSGFGDATGRTPLPGIGA